MQRGGVYLTAGSFGEQFSNVGALQASHNDPLDIVIQLLRGPSYVPALAGVVTNFAPVSRLPFSASGVGYS
jgi:hypothetical protein